MVLLRPSPNEEARMLEEETKRRRKLRLLQVREQSKLIAAQTRESVNKTVTNEYDKLARELEQDFKQKKEAREKFLQEMYLKSMHELGQAHKDAKAVSEDVKFESRRSDEMSAENHKKAIQRHHEAMSQRKFEQAVKHQNENRHIYARERALALEKERASLVASLPKPVDPIASSSASKMSSKDDRLPKSIAVVDYDGHIGTYFEASTAFVENEKLVEQEDGREAATREDEKQMFEAKCQMVMQQEQMEKARLRGKAALQQVQIENEYEEMCRQLESMKQQDLVRRQAKVAKISKNVFLPPHRREEEKIERQNKLEDAFEQIYSSRPGASEAVELQMSALGTEEGEHESLGSLELDDSGRVPVVPLMGVVKKRADKNNNSSGVNDTKDDQPLQKLLAKINNQREQISRQNVRLIEQFEPLVPVDERSMEDVDDSVDPIEIDGSGDACQLKNQVDVDGIMVDAEKEGSRFAKVTSSENELSVAPVPYEPVILSKDLKHLKDKTLDLSMEVPCRDVDSTEEAVRSAKSDDSKHLRSFDSSYEPIITSGPYFKVKPRSEASVQAGSPSKMDGTTGDLTNVTVDSLQTDRDTSPVSRYLEAVNSRELSSLSIEENLERIRKKNQQLLAKYQMSKRYEAVQPGLSSSGYSQPQSSNIWTQRSNFSEDSAPTKDVGLNRSKEKENIEKDLGRSCSSSDNFPTYLEKSSIGSSSLNSKQPAVEHESVDGVHRSRYGENLLFRPDYSKVSSKSTSIAIRTDPYPPFASPSTSQLRNHRLLSTDSDAASGSMTSVTMSDVLTPRSDYPSPAKPLLHSEESGRGIELSWPPSFLDSGRDQETELDYLSLSRSITISKPSRSSGNTPAVRPKQQTNIFKDDYSSESRTFGQEFKLPSERERYVPSSENVPVIQGDYSSYAEKTMRDPSIDWLLEKYKNLEIEYDNESMSNSEPFPDIQSTSFQSQDLSLNRSVSNGIRKQPRERPDIRFGAGMPSLNSGGYLEESINEGVTPAVVAPTGRVSFGDEVLNMSRTISLISDEIRTSITPRAEESTAFSLPPSGFSGSLIEIKGSGKRVSDVTIENQDLTTVTSVQTPINQKETLSPNLSSVYGITADQTAPFSPEGATNVSSQASPQDHSTPHSEIENRDSRMGNLDISQCSTASSKSSFTVVDGDLMRVIEMDLSRLNDLKREKMNASLKQEKIISPLSSSAGSSKVSITPETNLIEIQNPITATNGSTPPMARLDISGTIPSSDGSTESSGKTSHDSMKSGSMTSMSPEAAPDKTLGSEQTNSPAASKIDEGTPVVTSALAERKAKYPSQQFEPMPSIDLIDFDSTLTTSPEQEQSPDLKHKPSDGEQLSVSEMSAIGQFLSPEVMSSSSKSACSRKSASTTKSESSSKSPDTIAEQSGERLQTLAPSGHIKSLDEFSNSSPETVDGVSPETNASTVSTLAVAGPSGASLESRVPIHPAVKETDMSMEKRNSDLERSVNETTSTTSSFGLIDVNAVNASLSEVRISNELPRDTATSFNISQLSNKWANELKQYKMQTTDLDRSGEFSGSEARSLRSETGGGDSVFLNQSNASVGRRSKETSIIDDDISGVDDDLSPEQQRKGSGSIGQDDKKGGDFEISGISLIKDGEPASANTSVVTSLKV